MNKLLENIIAGAVFDFAAWLTARDTPLVIGASYGCGEVPPLVTEFLKLRHIETKNAEVENWEKEIYTKRKLLWQ